MSPYVHKLKNPAKEFPKGMIAMAVMVGICAVFGSFAMGMIFDSNNIPQDLMRMVPIKHLPYLENTGILGMC